MSKGDAFHLIGKRLPACETKRTIHNFVHNNPGLKGIVIAKKLKLSRSGVYPHLSRLVSEGKLRTEIDQKTNRGKLYFSVIAPEPRYLKRVRPTQCFGEDNLLTVEKPLVLTNNGEDLGYYIPKDLLTNLGLTERELSQLGESNGN